MEEAEEKVPLVNHCPECGKAFDVSGVSPYSKIECPHCTAVVRVRTTMGQYEIVGMLGEGGMSQVFRAVDRNLGREVALKILHQSLSSDSALTSMFEREAKLTASIVHPNVVKVFTVGKDHGYFFIAMEVVNATSLEQLIVNKGALSESEVLAIALDVTSGLKAAFGEDLIHRDIKPGNMLVTSEGTAKLVDFGLAVQQGGEDESEDLWATPFYVPPEKLEGEPDTFKGDIYSLGATLFHALAGKPPFEANTSSMEELKEIKKRVVDLKSVAPGLSKATIKLVEKMMAYNPADRHQSYEEVLAQIEDVQKRQFGIVPGGRARSGRKWLRTSLIAGLVMIVLSALGIAAFMNREQGGEEEGNLGIGSGERVISAGDSSVTEQFLRARDLLVNGDFSKAEKVFDELIAKESVPAPTRIWCHFFRGMIHLFSGEEEASRAAFASVLSISPGEGEGNTEAMNFMKKAAVGLADPLPLLDDEVAFSPASIESLGLLTAGLKNWQCGEFTSGVAFLKAFAGSAPPSEFQWISSLKSQVEPYVTDFATLENLPNPSAAESAGKLVEEEAMLRKVSESLRTRGGAPRLLKARLNRIGKIRELAAVPPKNVIVQPDPVVSTGGTKPVVPSAAVPVTPGSPGTPGAAELKEIERLKAVAASQLSLAETYLFSAAVVRLGAEPMETAMVLAIRDELVRGYGEAGRFLDTLALALRTNRYEGEIRRRAGSPIEAAITGADASMFIVDLGFGPNEVEVEAFAPDWLVETAAKVFPTLSNESAASWEKLVFFALFTGQKDVAMAKADEIAAIDPVFAKRWALIKLLK